MTPDENIREAKHAMMQVHLGKMTWTEAGPLLALGFMALEQKWKEQEQKWKEQKSRDRT